MLVEVIYSYSQSFIFLLDMVKFQIIVFWSNFGKASPYMAYLVVDQSSYLISSLLIRHIIGPTSI